MENIKGMMSNDLIDVLKDFVDINLLENAKSIVVKLEPVVSSIEIEGAEDINYSIVRQNNKHREFMQHVMSKIDLDGERTIACRLIARPGQAVICEANLITAMKQSQGQPEKQQLDSVINRASRRKERNRKQRSRK